MMKVQLVHLKPSILGMCLLIFHTDQEIKVLSSMHRFWQVEHVLKREYVPASTRSPLPGAARKVQAVGRLSLTRTLAGIAGELRSHTHKQPIAASAFSCRTKYLDAISRQHMCVLSNLRYGFHQRYNPPANLKAHMQPVPCHLHPCMQSQSQRAPPVYLDDTETSSV